MPDKQKPVHEVRVGSVKAAIWENPTENGARHNVTFERLYKSEDEWKQTQSFGRDDLLVLGVERYKIPWTQCDFHTEDDIQRLLALAAATSRQLEWTVLLGAWAGLRRIEIVNAKWEWFDFNPDQPVINVKAFPGFELKDKEDRTLPMHASIAAALQPHAQPEGFIFESHERNNGKSRYRYDPRSSLETALKRAGLSPEAPFHRLRDTFGSRLAQNGVEVIKISRWMGHSSVRMTEQRYIGLLSYDTDIDRI